MLRGVRGRSGMGVLINPAPEGEQDGSKEERRTAAGRGGRTRHWPRFELVFKIEFVCLTGDGVLATCSGVRSRPCDFISNLPYIFMHLMYYVNQ
jgi:hypothetical protein